MAADTGRRMGCPTGQVRGLRAHTGLDRGFADGAHKRPASEILGKRRWYTSHLLDIVLRTSRATNCSSPLEHSQPDSARPTRISASRKRGLTALPRRNRRAQELGKLGVFASRETAARRSTTCGYPAGCRRAGTLRISRILRA